jgi:hypothetical protein
MEPSATPDIAFSLLQTHGKGVHEATRGQVHFLPFVSSWKMNLTPLVYALGDAKFRAMVEKALG